MKKYILVIVFTGILTRMPAQNSQVAGQYHLAKTDETPAGWSDFRGSASVERNSNGSFNIRGNFLIQTNATTSLKANFISEDCIIPENIPYYTYPASGDVYVQHSDGSGNGRHFKIISISINTIKKEIRIAGTDPQDHRLTGWQIWTKGSSRQTGPPQEEEEEDKNNDDTYNNRSEKTTQHFTGCALKGILTDVGTLYESSNNAEIDKATREELRYLKASFLVSPAFFYYDDSEGKNAFSTDAQLAGSDSDDGTVCLGFGLLKEQISQSRWGTNIPVILAHEFAHTVARNYGLDLPTKENELFADYLAGGYMFYRSQNFKYTDVESAFRAFYNMGGNDFTSPDHHGTPASRVTCIRKGYADCLNAFRQGRLFTLDEGVRLAKEFVTTHNLP